jgi:HSP20 family protein
MLDLLYRLERRMGRFFNEPFGLVDWTIPETSAAWVPLVDIFEEAEFIRLVAEVPGVSPENLHIAVAGNVLTIKGTKEQAFERVFTLPATVDPSKIKATYENGLLTILLPKMETAKPHLIKVEVATPPKAIK